MSKYWYRNFWGFKEATKQTVPITITVKDHCTLKNCYLLAVKPSSLYMGQYQIEVVGEPNEIEELLTMQLEDDKFDLFLVKKDDER